MTEFNDPLSKRTELFGRPFADLASLPENDRIIALGNLVVNSDKPDFKIGCLVDREGMDGLEKANRYVRTLLSIFPNLKAEVKLGPTSLLASIFISKA